MSSVRQSSRVIRADTSSRFRRRGNYASPVQSYLSATAAWIRVDIVAACSKFCPFRPGCRLKERVLEFIMHELLDT